MIKDCPKMKIERVPSSPAMESSRQVIYRGNSMNLQLIPIRLRLEKPDSSVYFYIVKRASLINDKTVEVTQAVYCLSDLERGERHPFRYYGDRKKEFPLNSEKSLDGFLDRDL